MEEQTVAVYAPMTIFSSLNDEQREFAATIIKFVLDGDLDVALELLTFDGFGERILPPLEHSILKRVVLRLQCPLQPDVYLDQVDMDALHLTRDRDNVTGETLRQLYISVFTLSFHQIYVELMRRLLSHMFYKHQSHKRLEERLERLNIITDLPNELALTLILFGIFMCLFQFIDM